MPGFLGRSLGSVQLSSIFNAWVPNSQEVLCASLWEGLRKSACGTSLPPVDHSRSSIVSKHLAFIYMHFVQRED